MPRAHRYVVSLDSPMCGIDRTRLANRAKGEGP